MGRANELLVSRGLPMGFANALITIPSRQTGEILDWIKKVPETPKERDRECGRECGQIKVTLSYTSQPYLLVETRKYKEVCNVT